MQQSFNDQNNIQGLIKLLNSTKFDNNPYLENKFLNSDKLKEYDQKINNIDEELLDIQRESEQQQEALSEEQESENIPVDEPMTQSEKVNSNIVQQEINSNQLQNNNQIKQTPKDNLIRGFQNYMPHKTNIFNQGFQSNIPINIDKQQQNLLDRYFKGKQSQTNQNDTSQNYPQKQEQQPEQTNIINEYEKDEIIEDIDDLVQSLEIQGTKPNDIPKYDNTQSVQQLMQIKTILFRKWKRKYSRDIIEDVVYMIAKGAEKIFDGQTNILGFSPNLNGFSSTMVLGFKQHRQQVTKIVERNCNKYGIGVRDKFFIKVATSAIKRSILNQPQNSIDKHSNNMQSFLK